MDPDTYLSQFIALFNHIEVYPPDLGATIALVLSVLLLGCSGFVSASEIAFFSLSPTDVGKIEENRHAADSKILELKKDSERLLATILISNNFVNVNTDGTVNNNNANYSLGFAPGFYIDTGQTE